MKKVLIGLMALVSMSSFANEYMQEVFDCRISGDYTSLEIVMNIKLPETIPFKVSAKHIKGKNKIVSTSIEGIDLISIPKVTKRFLSFDRQFKIKFDDLTIAESMNILTVLGYDGIENLPKGFKLKNLKFYNGSWVAQTRSQVHFPISVNDGLSFHIDIRCVQRR